MKMVLDLESRRSGPTPPLNLYSLRLRGPGFIVSGWSLVVLLVLLTLNFPVARAQTSATPSEKRLQYQIKLKLDFENRSYSGSERVNWINRGDHPTAVLYFHLYS